MTFGGLARALALVSLAVAAGWLVCYLLVHAVARDDYSTTTLLFWPALLVARTGIWHAWALVLGIASALLWWSSRGGLRTARVAGYLFAGALYGAAGFAYRAVFPIPAPLSTPETVPSHLYWPEYRNGFSAGYRDGLVGRYKIGLQPGAGFSDGYGWGFHHGVSEVRRATSDFLPQGVFLGPVVQSAP